MRSLRWGRLVSLALGCCVLAPGLLTAQNLTVIGGTNLQKQLTVCIEHVSAEDLDRLPGLDHSMTIVILEHETFMTVKDSFAPTAPNLHFPISRPGECTCLLTCSGTWTPPCAAFPTNWAILSLKAPIENAAEGIRKRARQVPGRRHRTAGLAGTDQACGA